MVRTYGQMPTNLFVSAHLPHFKPPRPSDGGFGNNNPFNSIKLQLFKNIKGLKWGNFIASPDVNFFNPVPNFLYSLPNKESVSHFFTLYKDDVEMCYGMPYKTHLIAIYKSDIKGFLILFIDI